MTLIDKLKRMIEDGELSDQERATVEEARALIGKLPRTADGVPVAPGDHVYNLSPEGNAMSFRVLGGEGYSRCKSAVEPNTRAVAKCYSSAAGALAAGVAKTDREASK
jgi:hypothetical protein